MSASQKTPSSETVFLKKKSAIKLYIISKKTLAFVLLLGILVLSSLV
jgi:hypothetical protein